MKFEYGLMEMPISIIESLKQILYSKNTITWNAIIVRKPLLPFTLWIMTNTIGH